MKIVKRKISELKRANYNPRKLSPSQREHLTHSLSKFGSVDPIIVNINKDRENIIVGGHQRLTIAEEMGMDTVPTVEVDLSLEDEKELNVRLNKNTGGFDSDLLDEFFSEKNLLEWGFEFTELHDLFEDEEEDKEEKRQDMPAEMERQPFEHYDYLVFVFSNQADFINACDKFKISKARNSLHEKITATGIGRVLDGRRLIK